MPDITKTEFENFSMKVKFACLSTLIAAVIAGCIGYQYTTSDWPKYREEMFRKYVIADLMVSLHVKHWPSGKETVFLSTKKEYEERFPLFTKDAQESRSEILTKWAGGGALLVLAIFFSLPKVGFKKGV